MNLLRQTQKTLELYSLGLSTVNKTSGEIPRKWMFSVEKGKGPEAAIIVLRLSPITDLRQTVGEGFFSQMLVIFSIFYSALIDKLDQRVYGQLPPRLVGESKELFLGLWLDALETKSFVPSD